jgi:acyl dehydratase
MLAEVGHVVTLTHVFAQADFDRFAEVSGDDNPIHVDAGFAAGTRFGRPVSHGMLLYGLICGLLSRQFPGMVQLEQRLMFPSPTFAGEVITVRAEVVEVTQANRRARLTTVIAGEDGRVTCDGETVLAWS